MRGIDRVSSALLSRVICLALVAALLIGGAAEVAAAEWSPKAWTGQDTVDLQTDDPGEGPYWFPVWLVVIDGQLYVRLGTRAAGRVQKSKTTPYLGVRIAGQEFPRVKGVPVPEMADRVAAAMGDKYTSDFLVRFFSHPLTLRLEPEPAPAPGGPS